MLSIQEENNGNQNTVLHTKLYPSCLLVCTSNSRLLTTTESGRKTESSNLGLKEDSSHPTLSIFLHYKLLLKITSFIILTCGKPYSIPKVIAMLVVYGTDRTIQYCESNSLVCGCFISSLPFTMECFKIQGPGRRIYIATVSIEVTNTC